MAKEWIVSDEDLGCDGAYYSHKELVRCKNCEYWPYRPIPWNDDQVEYQTWPWCHRIGIRGGEGYCSEGERRREEDASNN